MKMDKVLILNTHVDSINISREKVCLELVLNLGSHTFHASMLPLHHLEILVAEPI